MSERRLPIGQILSTSEIVTVTGGSYLTWEKPFEHRVSMGCAGCFMTPIKILSTLRGEGWRFQGLNETELQLLKEEIAIMADEEKWSKVSPDQQLYMRIEASVLIERFAVSKISFGK